MHRILSEQLAEASDSDGKIDVDALIDLVNTTYEESDDCCRECRGSISRMVAEIAELQGESERLIAERTAELREREAELRTQNLNFEAAVNHMSQGLIMFDEAARMVICNRRYIEMYGLPSALAKPGCTLRELLDLRIARGNFTGDAVEYSKKLITAAARGEVVRTFNELGDGRIVAVVTQPMPHGGWVATHEDITERRRAEMKIAHMARHDALTNLPNRVFLGEALEQAIGRVQRGDQLAILYIDLDHFKTVNDTLGHPIGDELLQVVAERLLSCVPQTGIVARLGGDEFAVVQTGIDGPNDAAALAQKLCDTICDPYEINGHAAIVGCSIGIAIAPDDGRDPDRLMKNADMALHRAKADGRGTYRFFEPEMDELMQARRELGLALREVLPKEQLEIHYQPIMRLRDGAIRSFEALIRWQHPERGTIPPDEFVPIAEEIGLIVQLGEWVIRRACMEAATWPEDIAIAINLSPTQLLSPNLLHVVVNSLATAELAPHRLEIEITEAVLMQNTREMVATLHSLHNLGVQISMDDFGTGYSSLSYVGSFPFDRIKIDRCFICDLGKAKESAAIVRAITSLAASLGMATTAEGIETEEQMDHVRALGCSDVQGYLVSPPIPYDLTHDLVAAPPARMRAASGMG